MENEKVFKTKTGFCHILSDKIILTRDGIIGDIAKVTVEKSIGRILVIYGGLSLLLFYAAYSNFQSGKMFMSIFTALAGSYLIYGVLISLNNSATPVIDRKSIRKITLKHAIWGLTRSRFEVLFEDEKGKLKRRLIMLPGSLSGGHTETQKAIKILTEEELIVE